MDKYKAGDIIFFRGRQGVIVYKKPQDNYVVSFDDGRDVIHVSALDSSGNVSLHDSFDVLSIVNNEDCIIINYMIDGKRISRTVSKRSSHVVKAACIHLITLANIDMRMSIENLTEDIEML